MGQAKPWTVHLMGMLAKGPLPYSKVLAESLPFVPPGRAYRLAEKANESHRRLDRQKAEQEGRIFVPATPRAERSSTGMVRTGSRAIVRASIRMAVLRGRLEDYYEGDVRMLRIGPIPMKF